MLKKKEKQNWSGMLMTFYYFIKKILLKKKFFFIIFLLIGQTNNSDISIDVSNKKQKPLKILFVVSSFPPHSGTAVLNQITGLIDRGHQVYIYARKKGLLELGHPHMIQYNLLKHTYFNLPTQGKKKGQLRNLPPDLETFDIIYCQFGYRATEFLPIKIGRHLKAKFVTCFRGSDLSKHVKANPKKYDLLLKKGDLFLPVCNAFRKKLISLGGDPKKIIVHPSAIDCKKFSFKPRILHEGDAIKIVTVCRLVEKKGLSYAIYAIAKLIPKYPTIRYDIIGFGPLKRELKQLIKRLDVQDNVRLVGRASEDEVAAILGNAHIFLLPSVTASDGDREGIPNALKEAMARGMPVISTYHSGIPELVDDGVSGFLVPQRNSIMLAKKIEHLINNSSMWYEMGLAGHTKMKNNYDKEKVNDRLVSIFKKLVNQI